jgi:hypothetical protein
VRQPATESCGATRSSTPAARSVTADVATALFATAAVTTAAPATTAAACFLLPHIPHVFLAVSHTHKAYHPQRPPRSPRSSCLHSLHPTGPPYSGPVSSPTLRVQVFVCSSAQVVHSSRVFHT